MVDWGLIATILGIIATASGAIGLLYKKVHKIDNIVSCDPVASKEFDNFKCETKQNLKEQDDRINRLFEKSVEQQTTLLHVVEGVNKIDGKIDNLYQILIEDRRNSK